MFHLPWIFCLNPKKDTRALVVRMSERQTAGGNDAVGMREMLHFLSPGMEHAEESDLSPEAFGIASDFEECLGTETQQQPVDEFLVLQGKGCQESRHRENDVSVRDGKKLFAPSLNPAPAVAGGRSSSYVRSTKCISPRYFEDMANRNGAGLR